jgi:hypothetical protein
LIDDEAKQLIVPSSQAYPAKFDLQTGELKSFELPAPGRLPGGWFASTPSELERQKLKRRGLLFDNEVNYRVTKISRTSRERKESETKLQWRDVRYISAMGISTYKQARFTQCWWRTKNFL